MGGGTKGYQRHQRHHFQPGQNLLLWRACGCPEPGIGNPFSDVPENTHYTAAGAWAVEEEITTCTRGQIVTLLYQDLA